MKNLSYDDLSSAHAFQHTIQIGAVILSIGAGLCAGSVDVGMFLFARFFAGIGIGMSILSQQSCQSH